MWLFDPYSDKWPTMVNRCGKHGQTNINKM